MKKIVLALLTGIGASALHAQAVSNDTKRFGILGSFDLAYNFHDKVVGPGMGRKIGLALSFTPKNRTFIAFAGAGFKGWKLNLYSPRLQEAFVSDVQQHYVPIAGTSEDSLIGAKMNSGPNPGFWGTYAQYLYTGFIFRRSPVHPTFSFYCGYEHYLLYGDGFSQYEDPKYNDIRYMEMPTVFYELKAGCALPFRKLTNRNCSIQLNLGYKWVDYGDLAFKDTPLSAYTTGSLKDKYGTAGKFTASISIFLWSNWE